MLQSGIQSKNICKWPVQNSQNGVPTNSKLQLLKNFNKGSISYKSQELGMDGVEKASDAIFKCHETPKVIEYYCSEPHVLFYLWKKECAPVNSLLPLSAFLSRLVNALRTKRGGRSCYLWMFFTSSCRYYAWVERSRNLCVNIERVNNLREKSDRSGGSSKVERMPLL